MWKPKLELAPSGAPYEQKSNNAMAHRRAVGGRKVVLAILLLSVFAVLSAGSVYVSNRTTGMRAEIAQLENRREFLEAGSARLLTIWNKATAPSVIAERAHRELGLIVPDEPSLVLVAMPAGDARVSRWRLWLENVGGGDPAEATIVQPTWVIGSMVSLTPGGAPGRRTSSGY